MLPVLLAIFGPDKPVDAGPVSHGVDMRRSLSSGEEAGGSETLARMDGGLREEGEARV